MPDWDQPTVDRLRSLWGEGHSTSIIGQRLGVSKNAVVGKAHRLNLPARPSPIRITTRSCRSSADKSRRRQLDTTPDDLASLTTDGQPVLFAPLTPAATAKLPTVHASPLLASSRPLHSTHQCSWPIGEPGTASFHFCTSNAEVGRPYCPAHCSIAYKPRRSRVQMEEVSFNREAVA